MNLLLEKKREQMHDGVFFLLKFRFPKKATKIDEITTLDLMFTT